MATDCTAEGMGSVVERESLARRGALPDMQLARRMEGIVCVALCRGGTRTDGAPMGCGVGTMWHVLCWFLVCVLDRDRGVLSPASWHNPNSDQSLREHATRQHITDSQFTHTALSVFHAATAVLPRARAPNTAVCKCTPHATLYAVINASMYSSVKFSSRRAYSADRPDE